VSFQVLPLQARVRARGFSVIKPRRQNAIGGSDAFACQSITVNRVAEPLRVKPDRNFLAAQLRTVSDDLRVVPIITR
jgi:hypothetical protein